MLTCMLCRLATAPPQDLQLQRKTQINPYQRRSRGYCRMQVQYVTMEVTSSTEWKTYATLRTIVLNPCLQVALIVWKYMVRGRIFLYAALLI